MIAGTKIKV